MSQQRTTTQASTAVDRRRRAVLIGLALLVLLLLAFLNRLTAPPVSHEDAASASEPGAAGAESSRGRPPGVVDYMQDPVAANRLVEQLAQETGGDFSKLSEGRQRMLNAMAAGRGRDLLRNTAQRLATKASAKK
jgi:hypothetical protein